MTAAQATIVFVPAAAAVTAAGVQLSRAGDEIAERAGLSRLFVGMLLVAGATSLPEIVTDVSAATLTRLTSRSVTFSAAASPTWRSSPWWI